MFRKVNSFIERLSVYIQQEITTPLRKIFVETLAQLLVVLGVATKSMKQNPLGAGLVTLERIPWLMTLLVRYSKSLFGKNTDIKDAMEKLQELSSQEAPMVTAVILATTAGNAKLLQVLEGRSFLFPYSSSLCN